MKIIEKQMNIDFKVSDYIKNIKNEDVIIFDIETTGFVANRTYLYLIGYILCENGNWVFKQLFAENIIDESEILYTFYDELLKRKTLIHFNGDTFDIPYLIKKSNQLNISNKFNDINSIDIYKIVKPFKKIFKMDSMKLKNIEKFLGIYREDQFTGGDLISQYYDYLTTKDKSLEINLLLHNEEDLMNLPKVFEFLTYINTLNSLKSGNFKIDEINNIDQSYEVVLNKISPFNLSFDGFNYKLKFEKDKNIKLYQNIINTELKYFLDDHKDYFFIPDMNKAIHKTIASSLPSERKEKAKKSTCYIPHHSNFINVFNNSINLKIFKSDYKSKELFVESNAENIVDVFHKNIIDILN
ncbi:MAG: ribonuclease H-like domain-containing protein [Clostridia bacterium]|jgi:uncharacterized protein YprB with RNaseH-like and TPR domain|nr:ribonuclease H-like domain-containing protein [Clostridia bacterium]